MLGSIFIAGWLNRVNAIQKSIGSTEYTPQQQRIVRKAKFIEKNCIVYQQGELIKKKRAKASEHKECNACVAACPRKSITTKEIQGAKGEFLPVLDVTTCIGCSRCLRVCPQEPKAWEIWDTTNNTKLM